MNQSNRPFRIAAHNLSEAAFSVYGEVIQNKTALKRRDFAVPFAGIHRDAVSQLWVNLLQPCTSATIDVDVMECHPRSPQSFIPLREVPYLVVVALPGDDGLPDLQTLKAFVCEGGAGVSYRNSVWHFAFTSLTHANEVVVIMSNTGSDDDTIITRLAQPVKVNLPVGELG